jgi:hypothetical protein
VLGSTCRAAQSDLRDPLPSAGAREKAGTVLQVALRATVKRNGDVG